MIYYSTNRMNLSTLTNRIKVFRTILPFSNSRYSSYNTFDPNKRVYFVYKAGLIPESKFASYYNDKRYLINILDNTGADNDNNTIFVYIDAKLMYKGLLFLVICVLICVLILYKIGSWGRHKFIEYNNKITTRSHE